jgi:hypothetical protein
MEQRSSTRRVWLPPILDLLCICGFILVGSVEHNINDGIGWFLKVLWPLAVGWYAIALVTKLYTSTDRIWGRLAVTLAGGTLIGLVLREVGTDRRSSLIFTAVFVAWMILTAFGWRFVARLWVMRRARRQRVARAM